MASRLAPRLPAARRLATLAKSIQAADEDPFGWLGELAPVSPEEVEEVAVTALDEVEALFNELSP